MLHQKVITSNHATFASVDHYLVNIPVKENLEKNSCIVVGIVEKAPKNKRWELFKIVTLPTTIIL